MSGSADQKWKKLFYSRWFLIAIALIFVIVVFAYARAYYQDYEVRQEIERLQEEARRLDSKKLNSMELLKYVQSEAFVEERARNELNMAKPGENVAIIRQEGALNEGGQEFGAMLQFQSLANPVKWFQYFKNHF